MKAVTLLFVGMMLTSALGCREKGTSSPSVPAAAAPAAPSLPVPEPHDFGEFAFVIPDDWTIATPDANKTQAMLLLGGATWQEAKAMIKVDVGEPTAETPQGLAQKIVQGTGGVILPEPVNFDGTTGVSVMTNSKDLKTPKHFVILMRGGKVYLVMVAETEGSDVLNAMQTILDSWKWRDQNPGPTM